MDTGSVGQQGVPSSQTAFLLTLAIVFLVSMAVLFALFSLAYIKDVQTIRTVPDLIWNFACGRPLDNNIALPLLLTLSILSLGISGVLGIWRWWLGRSIRLKAA